MRYGSRHVRMVVSAALAGLAFEWVAFSDFDGAYADDLELLKVGAGGGSSSTPPPNIVFLFSSAASMNNLVCEDLTGSAACVASGLTTKSAPNGATVCEHPTLTALVGLDRDSDGDLDAYKGAYDSNGTTWGSYLYPMFDPRGKSDKDDYYTQWATFGHAANAKLSKRQTGKGNNDQARIDDVIKKECDQITNCNKRSRCRFSLRTLGYFWEPSAASCGTGNPLSLTCKKALGETCSAASECESNECDGGKCSECNADSDCSGSCLAVGGGCTYRRCQGSTCGGAVTLGSLGDSCSSAFDCYSGECKDGECSECDGNPDCGAGGTCKAADASCSYAYCDGSACAGGPGGAVGGGGPGDPAVFLGNFLNFYPAKGIGLVKAFDDAISDMTGDARMGFSVFSDAGSNTIKFDIKPPCSQSTGSECFDGDASTVCFNPETSGIRNQLNKLTFTGASPLAKALDNAGKYYTTATGVDTPICDYSSVSKCSTNNFVVIVSDGLISSDATAASQVPHANTWGPFDATGSPAGDGFFQDQTPDQFIDDVAHALTFIDHRSNIANDQTVDTYTVSYGAADAADPSRCAGILQTTAGGGGGVCLLAKNVDELRQALSQIIKDIVNRAR
ncbi:MAG: hypothetical protein HYZ27_00725, partial [Deltaproteobacteria bacterium]|nr:hypothetical protein [Deltaproteobacteria bacterium]